MENPALLNIKQRSSKSRSRSRTPMQKFFSSAEDMDVPAMNTRSSSRNLYIITDEDDAHHTYVTSDYSSEDGNISPTTVQNIDNTEKENKRNGHKEERQRTEAELLAYKEYKEAGEYWNKYPKTDYTYSKRSPHRRELPGGSVALPNMSRPSLHSFDERMDKKFLAERINYYESSKIKKSTYSTSAGSSSDGMRLRNSVTKTTSYKDTEFSDDEMPSQSYYYNGRDVTDVMVEQEGLFRRFWSKMVSVGRWTKSWFVDVEESHAYRTPIRRRNAERGFFSRCYSKTQNGVLWFFSQIYWLITLVSLFDCKLLCGRETPPRSRKRGLVLLLLLPLLLLCALWLYLHSLEDLSVKSEEALNLLQSLPERSYNYLQNAADTTLEVLSSPGASFLNLCSYFSNCALDLVSRSLQFASAIYSSLTESIFYIISSCYDYLLYFISVVAGIWSRNDQVKSSHFENLGSGISDRDLYHRIDMYVDRYLKDNSAAYVKDSLVSQPNLKIISDTIKNEFQLHQNSVYDSNFITKVAGLVREKLNEYPQKLVLTPAHFKEIKNALQSGTMKLDSKNFDVSILIQDLIQHPLLQNLVTQSGLNVDKDYLVNQQKVLFDLEKQIRANNLEIERLKNMNQETDIVKLQNTVNILKEQQINLKDDLAKVRVEFKEKLSSLNIEFKKLLSDILGYDVNNNSVSFKAWINEAFLAKDVLENKLNELRNNVKVDSQSTMDASAAVLMKHIGDSIKLAILRYDEKQQKMHADLKNYVTNNINSIRGSVSQSSIDLSGFDVQEIVRKALAKYDADKTGLVDYALESGGGQVLTTRCTETYSSRTAQYTWFNIPLWYSSNSPRTAITPGTHPGQCWAFQSFPGYLVLQLSLPIQVTGFTMEHVPKELVANGNIDSAPRNFSVWGLKEEQDQNPSLFGYFEYEYDGPSLQYFQVKSDETNQQYFNIVELRVESNHGNPVFSCLYRFRVHGTPITKDEMEKFRSR